MVKLSPIFLPFGVAGSSVVPKQRVVLLTCERLMVARDPRRVGVVRAGVERLRVLGVGRPLQCREVVRPLKVKIDPTSEFRG